MASIDQFVGSSIIHIKKEKIGKRWIKFMKETYKIFRLMIMLVHSLKNEKKLLMAKVNKLFKTSWAICQRPTFLNIMVIEIRKREN